MRCTQGHHADLGMMIFLLFFGGCLLRRVYKLILLFAFVVEKGIQLLAAAQLGQNQAFVNIECYDFPLVLLYISNQDTRLPVTSNLDN